MSHQNLVDSLLSNVMFTDRAKMSNLIVDAGAATYTLGASHPPVLVIDPGGGAISLLLPTEADGENMYFLIVNTANAAETITVKEDTGTTTIVTIAQNKAAIVYCDGTTWHGLVGGVS